MKKISYVFIAVLSALYVLNPTAGIFEFIPDNIPIVGNIDEAAAIGFFLYAMKNLGFDLNKFFSNKKDNKTIIIEKDK
ncbi:MAG: DUF1232 domain-containing protein [Chitinophagales bacterium]|nr:DUF1232 domain-containing protein [Chitinophagales bacterium]